MIEAANRRPTKLFNNPSAIDADAIAQSIAKGEHLVVQFSTPSFTDAMLDALNALCERHGDAVSVRFYGFYSSRFDCRALRRLPAVASLRIDCVTDVENLDEVTRLTRLRDLGLGIFSAQRPSDTGCIRVCSSAKAHHR